MAKRPTVPGELKTTQRMPERPADELARDALLAVLGDSARLRATSRLVSGARAELRRTLRRPSRPVPVSLGGDADPKAIANAWVRQAARTIKTFPVSAEIDLREAMEEFGDVVGHITPAHYQGEGRLDPQNQIKAGLMGRAVEIEVRGKPLNNLADAFLEAVTAYDNLIPADAIKMGDDLTPALSKVREAIPEDFKRDLTGHLTALEQQVRAIMGAIQMGGVNAVMNENGSRAESLMVAVEQLTKDLVAGHDQFGKTKLFPQMPEAKAVIQAAAPYGEMKTNIMNILSAGDNAAGAKMALNAQLAQAHLSPALKNRIPALVNSLVKKHKREGGTAEELADHIVEVVLTLELQEMLKSKSTEEPIEASAIAQKFYVLVKYTLHHLRNSLGSQLVPALAVDSPEKDQGDGIVRRMVDWNYHEDGSVSDELYRVQVTTMLLTVLCKCLRALRIARYQRAFLGTLTAS